MSRNLPVLYAAAHEAPRAAPRQRERLGAVYAAQLLGQDGQKRGLKGGTPVLAAARVAYLETEYSGADDRRPSVGLLRSASV
jgi:hypothetical protein